MRGSTRTSSHASERAPPRPNLFYSLRKAAEVAYILPIRFLLSDFPGHFCVSVQTTAKQEVRKKIGNLRLSALGFCGCRRSEADVLREFLQGFESTRQGGVVSFSEFERYFAINTVRSQQPRPSMTACLGVEDCVLCL